MTITKMTVEEKIYYAALDAAEEKERELRLLNSRKQSKDIKAILLGIIVSPIWMIIKWAEGPTNHVSITYKGEK